MIMNMLADLAKTMDSRNINRPCRHSKRARLWVLLQQGDQCTAIYWVGSCRCRYDWTGGILSRYPGSAQVLYGTAKFCIRGEAICECDVVSKEWARNFGLERARCSRNSHCLQSAQWRAMDWDSLRR